MSPWKLRAIKGSPWVELDNEKVQGQLLYPEDAFTQSDALRVKDTYRHIVQNRS